MTLIVLSWVLLPFLLAGLLALAGYMTADLRDETIGQDQFRRERAAILEQVQGEQRARFVQQKERA